MFNYIIGYALFFPSYTTFIDNRNDKISIPYNQ